MTLHASPPRDTGPVAAGPPLAQLPGVRLAVVLWGGLALIDVCTIAGAPSYVGLAALALLAMASSVGMGMLTGLAAGSVGWLLVNGFVVHRDGVLRYDGPADLARLALLLGLAALATRVHR